MDKINFKNELTSVILHSSICIILILGFYQFQCQFPVAYQYFVSEDYWVEYGTFLFYLFAGGFLFYAMKMDRTLKRPGFILLFLALVFVALEEISWGQRLLGVQTPYFIGKHNIQAELTVHNASSFPSQYILSLGIFMWAVILPVFYRFLGFVRSWTGTLGVPLVPGKIQPYFVLGFILKNNEIVIRHEEIGEMMLGFAFMFFTISLFCSVFQKVKKKEIVIRRMVGLSSGAVLTLTILLILIGPKDVYALKRLMHRSAKNQYPQRGMDHQAKAIYEYLSVHEQLKNDETLLEYGLFLRNSNDPDSGRILMQALSEAQKGMISAPENPLYNRLAGKIFKLLDNLESAESEFQNALRKDEQRLAVANLDWEHVRALRSLGETYIEIGNYPLAREFLNAALKMAEDGWTKARIEDLLISVDGFGNANMIGGK